MKNFVFGGFVVGLFLKMILQTMFSSINSLQVTAHIPLLNFNMPAKAYFIYDILIQIVVFDILPFTDYVNFNFNRT